MSKKTLRITIAGLLFAAIASTQAAADALKDIVERGSLSVGVKADFAPWGMRDAAGNLVGLEIDLAQDFAKRLSKQAGKDISLNLVVVATANRMEFLEQGRIDVLIATMSDTPERRKVVGIVQPDYYSSGIAVLARKDSGINGWESINGKAICGIQGSWFNKDYGTKKGADMVAFKGVPEAEAAFLAGRCAGWLYDDSAFTARIVADPNKWADYAVATPVVADVPWGAAVRKDEVNEPLGAALSAAIIDWHKSGLISELEKKWHIPESAWVRSMHEKCLAGDKACASVREE
ncbi:transporter substrate-binding domain-containing protein [Mesorhizobium silamurunense]|uniref:transporter substrate-binding domain-containing protein n=1 Tax=Mesorhizobium silamurunense TaxID=499528 RepID=UPI00177DE55A|nr:transporter substrate-binding domain-containing protein [Mesorhizobium silamurunense]